MNEQDNAIISSAYYSKIVKGSGITSVFDMITNGGKIRCDKFAPWTGLFSIQPKIGFGGL